jgi:hypothetical protein
MMVVQLDWECWDQKPKGQVLECRLAFQRKSLCRLFEMNIPLDETLLQDT